MKKKSLISNKITIRSANFQKNDQDLTVNDCLTVLYDTSSRQRQILFPTFSACSSCGKYNGIIGNGRHIDRYDLLREVLLVKYGHYLKHYDSDLPSAPCTCKQDLLRIQERLIDLPLLDEQGWVGSPGGRAITDYTKRVQFARNLTDSELNLFLEYLKLNKCPGWTGISYKRLSEGIYLFSTCQDRSG